MLRCRKAKDTSVYAAALSTGLSFWRQQRGKPHIVFYQKKIYAKESPGEAGGFSYAGKALWC
ncbi:hypothetical protein CLOSTMETH_00940 [[Clostridium] methylpentosum DSM 5476]|uniref:Uncharacterized protein n=1 Tax=[Clostridium] methylpentosum DSM 5476 TaxID=537013 RepID=C0EAS6_9FIRM|nr:hypothetical protein CLOSTMETH_00940 [[Clostridium] methylpentosum DSM 5476]